MSGLIQSLHATVIQLLIIEETYRSSPRLVTTYDLTRADT